LGARDNEFIDTAKPGPRLESANKKKALYDGAASTCFAVVLFGFICGWRRIAQDSQEPFDFASVKAIRRSDVGDPMLARLKIVTK
jgi:hypothetical protein